MLAPSVCLIGQGRKRLFLGDEAYVYDAHRFLITSVDLPVVHISSRRAPTSLTWD